MNHFKPLNLAVRGWFNWGFNQLSEFKKLIKELDMDSSATVSQAPRGVSLEIDGDICFQVFHSSLAQNH